MRDLCQSTKLTHTQKYSRNHPPAWQLLICSANEGRPGFGYVFICIYMYNHEEYDFEWDLLKELANVAKHGLSFQEGTEVFYDSQVIHLEDPEHSTEEDRYYAVGKSKSGRILTVRYTTRTNTIRIFGVAEWRKWRKYYEENTRSQKNAPS